VDVRSVVELLALLVGVGLVVGLGIAYFREKALSASLVSQRSDAFVKGWLGAELKRMKTLTDEELMVQMSDSLEPKDRQ
jgi:hypothetical protein